ncbi:MAG: radical SAM protein [Acidobacteriota bacterium]
MLNGIGSRVGIRIRNGESGNRGIGEAETPRHGDLCEDLSASPRHRATASDSNRRRPEDATIETESTHPLLSEIDRFVESTRAAIFVRQVDRLLMIRPDKTLGLNDSAVKILAALYNREGRPAAEVLCALSSEVGVPAEQLVTDADGLVQTLRRILHEDFSPSPNLRLGSFTPAMVRYPTLAEIALTYGCQNRCAFCYAASPLRAREHRMMSVDEVERVMDRIFHEAHVPSLSFTGGEATLRPELPELIAYGASLGFRVNLITNGVRAADLSYTRLLSDSGLASAQVSLEAGCAQVHDRIVGREGAFEQTVAGIRHFQRLGIHVHTNSTLCAANLDAAHDLIRFAGRDLGLGTISMNMVIRTGTALSRDDMEVSYTEVGRRLPALLDTARSESVRLVWYSPIPYCIFNPVLHGLGAKSCACVSGILSVAPDGEVLPCSSFAQGIGSLLTHSYESIRRGRAAEYWKKRLYVPPACTECADVDVCAGACPLYWDVAGGFGEIPRAGAGDTRARASWERLRKRGRSYGVGFTVSPRPRVSASDARALPMQDEQPTVTHMSR